MQGQSAAYSAQCLMLSGTQAKLDSWVRTVEPFMSSSGWDAVGAAVARRYGAVFVPGGTCYDSRYRGFDGLHMNATGHQDQVIATRLLPVMQKLLAPARLIIRAMGAQTRRMTRSSKGAHQGLGTCRTRIGQLGALKVFWRQLENIRHSAELGKRTGLHLPHHVGAMHLHRGFGDADIVGNLFVETTGRDLDHDLTLAGAELSKRSLSARKALSLSRRARSRARPASTASRRS